MRHIYNALAVLNCSVMRITFGCAVAASIKCRWAAAPYRKVRQGAAAHLLP